jgi:hypothetical protein
MDCRGLTYLPISWQEYGRGHACESTEIHYKGDFNMRETRSFLSASVNSTPDSVSIFQQRQRHREGLFPCPVRRDSPCNAFCWIIDYSYNELS